MASIKGTRTEKNLLASFAGESQARGRYTYFASVAKKEGYEQIAAIFLETAEQEKEHAKKFFKFLEGGMVEITSTYPAGIISTTLENLKAAAEGENEEWTVLYPEAAKVAREEGFTEIAVAFEMIAKVEAEHEARYRKLLERVETGTVFERDGEIYWQCRNCGYVHKGKKELRLRTQRQESSGEMPCLPASQGILRAKERELLNCPRWCCAYFDTAPFLSFHSTKHQNTLNPMALRARARVAEAEARALSRPSETTRWR